MVSSSLHREKHSSQKHGGFVLPEVFKCLFFKIIPSKNLKQNKATRCFLSGFDSYLTVSLSLVDVLLLCRKIFEIQLGMLVAN